MDVAPDTGRSQVRLVDILSLAVQTPDLAGVRSDGSTPTGPLPSDRSLNPTRTSDFGSRVVDSGSESSSDRGEGGVRDVNKWLFV